MYEAKDLIFVFKTHYLYMKLGLICIETETELNRLNMIPMLLVVGDQTREEVIKNHSLKMSWIM